MTEQDTFLKLKRKPLEFMSGVIFSIENADISDEDLYKLLESHGWTFNEIMEACKAHEHNSFMR